ncbi:MAG TPA: two-component regulator propeller domain-containing protein [Verrucomicrobiae bacterium]|nr:two-component regulator propeller domain-containing protein [Verrucomicrobiae bacterium]
MRAVTVLAIAWCSVTARLFATDTNEPVFEGRFVIKSWGTEGGLPQNTVNTLVQTREGYLWLGTQGGLARFDGVRFKVFGLAEGLPSIQVQALHEDRHGQLWVGTLGGLSRMRNGRFKTFSNEPGFTDDVNVSKFADGPDDQLWIGTSAGLVVWQENKVVALEALNALARAPVRDLLRLRSGEMWIATSSGLFEFKAGKLNEIIGPPTDQKITTTYSMLEDRAGNIWVSIGNGKVLCRRADGWHTFNEAFGLPFAFISSLAESDDGTIWAGSLDQGLYYLQDGQFHVVRERDGLSDDAIRSLLADREGHLWVGTRSAGLNRLTQKTLMVFGTEAGLTNEFVRSVAETADEALWVATIGGGMYRGQSGRFESVPSVVGTVTYPFFESVVALRDGSVWWGGAGALFQWKDNQIITNYTRPNVDWLANAGVTALLEDVHEGLWIGTTRGKLLRLRKGQFEPVPHRVARGALTALEQEKDGTLWVGSLAGGLVRMGRDGVSTFSTTNGLLSNEIRTLRRDEEGTLWIGTGGGGLSRLKSGRIESFTTHQGLGDDTVSQILEDDRGRLWLGCNRGIFRVDKTELDALKAGKIKMVHCRAFGVSEGMPVEECSGGFSPAGLKTKSGKLCFSTHKGVVLLNPDAAERDAQPPHVLIEEVLVEGTNATQLAERAVTIPPGRQDIEFRYTGLSFMAPSKVQFRYRLKDYDREWTEAGTRRAAYYARIPPGNYVFEVRACNANNVWTETPATLAVTVQPYFWETRWFPVLSGLVILGGLAGTVHLIARQRYKRRLAQLEMRHAIERERLRISQDMHDDIGSILTRVSILSDVGQTQTDPAKAAPQFERIGTQVRAAVVALDEIVWATNPGDDNLPRFAEYVGRFADECFENTPVRCWQEMPTDLPRLPLRADIRHNVFLAVKEALNNVLKHSNASEVWLRLKLLGSSVRVEVEDNGRGFVADSAPAAGNGLKNMQSRLSECGGRLELTSAPGKGTRIAFVFPLPRND